MNVRCGHRFILLVWSVFKQSLQAWLQKQITEGASKISEAALEM